MISFLLPFYVIVACSKADDTVEVLNAISSKDSEHSFIIPEVSKVAQDKKIENFVQKFENVAAAAEKSRSGGILPIERVDDLYRRMAAAIEDITEQLKQKSNVYKFLHSKGVDRIITPTIGINHEQLKIQLLIIIKTLFNVAPISTNAVIPISVVDKLLDIFENDDNLALKAHALDILHIWLPNNPAGQARVMKLKGLEPFYHQVSKLDVKVIHTLLDLFNKILEEHLEARNNKSQKTKEDYERRQLYQMIGLVERMNTPQVCNGIFNILDTLMVFTNDDTQISPTIFQLVKNIKPFCLRIYKGKNNVIRLFDELKKYVTNPEKIHLLESLDLNTTDVRIVVDDFVKNLKESVRDEF